MHKEQKSHRKSKQRNKEQPIKAVKKCRRQPSANGILPALHTDVVNLLGIATHIARHKVVKKQTHIIKLEQMPVAHFHVLLFEQKFPLQARRKVRKSKAEHRDNQGPRTAGAKEPIQIVDAPVRSHHDVSVHKVGGNRGHHQFQAKDQHRFQSAIHFTHFLPPPVAL